MLKMPTKQCLLFVPLAAAFMVANSSLAAAGDMTYLYNRSTPQTLVESCYFAISNRYFAQAYACFQEGAAPADFDTWSKGYSDTGAEKVKFGATTPNPGAGQIHWTLPVVISAVKTDGTTDVHSGCYKIHLSNPGMQSDPPYQSTSIISATLRPSNRSFETAVPGPC